MKHKNKNENIDKKIIILAAVAVITVIIEAIIMIAININKSSGVSVRVIAPSKEIFGGATKYEVTGVSSVVEANKAIILEEYNNSGSGSFRKISEKEAQDIAEQIEEAGCGQITEEHVLAPPVSGAINWRNFSNDNHDTIETYMLDDEFLVYVDCAKKLDN